MWSPPDKPSTPEDLSTTYEMTSNIENAPYMWRPANWQGPAEEPIWAPMQPVPHNGPANASFICGILSVLMLCALGALAVLFQMHSGRDDRFLLAAIVVAEEGIVPSTLAIYFGQLASRERFEPMLTDGGRFRSRLGILLGCISFVVILLAGMALIVASRR